MKKEEYAVDVYDKATEKFLYQVDVFDTYENAEQIISGYALKDSEYLVIIKIEYDEDGNEIGTEFVY